MNEASAVILAYVLGLAGTLKLLDPPDRESLAPLLGKTRGAHHVLRFLPTVEILVAAGLMWPATARFAGLAAAMLLGTFTVVLFTAMRRGQRLPCGCFGRSSRAAVSTWTLSRNLLLFLAAVAVIADPSLVRLWWRAGVALAVLATVIIVLAREVRRLRRLAAHGRAVPPEALDEALPTTEGSVVTLRAWLQARGRLLVVFVDPVCAPCLRLLPLVASWQRASNPDLAVAVISRGEVGENESLARELMLAPIAVQRNDEVSRRFGITGTPSALLLEADGRPRGGPVAGAPAIVALAESVAPDLGRGGQPVAADALLEGVL